MAKAETIIIKAKLKVAIGHQPHARGCGTWSDRRTHRNRTRSDQRRNALKGW